MKKLWAILLCAALMLGLVCGAAAEEEKKETGEPPVFPGILKASYLNDEKTPMVGLEYTDPQNRTFEIEVYLLKKGEVKPNMGTVEADGETYSIVGIQTIDVRNPEVYQLTDGGTTVLNTVLYFGSCGIPAAGDEVFLAVGLAGKGEAEELSELIPFTVPEAGETFEYSWDESAGEAE